MKRFKFLSLALLAFSFFECKNESRDPWEYHAWACEASKNEPYLVYRHQNLGKWRLGWYDPNQNQINWSDYNWQSKSSLPALHETFTVSGETWFIIDYPAIAGSTTSKSCTSGCVEYCKSKGGVFSGEIRSPGKSLNDCNCIFN